MVGNPFKNDNIGNSELVPSKGTLHWCLMSTAICTGTTKIHETKRKDEIDDLLEVHHAPKEI